MLTEEIKATATQLGILNLAEQLCTSVSAVDGIDDVILDFANWEPNFPCITIAARHHFTADMSVRQRSRIIRPIRTIAEEYGLKKAYDEESDEKYLYFYYRTKTKADYTLYPSDFGLAFVPTVEELQQLQTEFAAWDGDKEAFTNDFHHRSRAMGFYEARAGVIARLLNQLSETEKRHREELAAKDRLIADLQKALEKARNS